MKRIEKLGDMLLATATYPIRFCIGAYKAIETHMPENIELPIEIKVKEDKDGSTGEKSNFRREG